MAAVSSRKCQHFNIGYCKYKDKGCKNIHPEETCVLQKCTNKDCPRRHQKVCRYKESCIFHKTQSCEYAHKTNHDYTNNELVAKKQRLR